MGSNRVSMLKMTETNFEMTGKLRLHLAICDIRRRQKDVETQGHQGPGTSAHRDLNLQHALAFSCFG